MGAPTVSPVMKFGAAASEGVDGPGGWRFDPGQRIPGPDSLPMTPAMPQALAESAVAMNPPLSSPTANAPTWPAMPFMPPMPLPYPPAQTASAVPMPRNYDDVSASSADALQISASPDSDVADPRAAEAMLPAAPPAPGSVYPPPCATSATASGVSYRCDGYRRVARAKP